MFSKSVSGALEKINYPTGGYTKLNYESNKALLSSSEYEKLVMEENQGTLETNTRERITLDENDLDSSGTISESKSIIIPSNQIIKVTMQTHYDEGVFGAEAFITSSNGNYLTPRGEGDNVAYVSEYVEIFPNEENINNDIIKNYESYFSVRENQEVFINAAITDTNFKTKGRVRITLHYNDSKPATHKEILIGGIRISSIEDCTLDNNCVEKKYNYKGINNFSSGKLLTLPIYSDIKEIIALETDSGGGFKDSYTCLIEQFSSSSRIPLASFQGSSVLYQQVETIYNNGLEKGKTTQIFSYKRNGPASIFPYAPHNPKGWKNGNLIKETILNKELDTVKQTNRVYEDFYPHDFNLSSGQLSIGLIMNRKKMVYQNGSLQTNTLNDYQNEYYYERPEFHHSTSTTNTDYLNGNEVSTLSTNTYDLITGYPTEQETTNSKGKILKSVNTYPTSGRLVTENRISSPINVKNYKKEIGSSNEDKLSEQHTIYNDFGDLYLPDTIQTAKGNQALEARIVYHHYDNKGNPVEVSKKDGTHIVYIWGYNKTQPIAKIENVTYRDLRTAITTISDARFNTLEKIQAISNSDDNRVIGESNTGEGLLRKALNKLRDVSSLSNAQVTTYTYDPLIGVTSITDPRRQTIYYHYDEFNRLKHVKDKEGNILSKNEYNYKN